MKPMEAVKAVMEKTNFTTTALCEGLGIDKKKSNVLSQRFTQENVSVKKLNEMLSVMGYKVVVMPTNVKTPKDGFKIE
jgi:antitoxin component HigA of HigAB toxin-antitoxin module